MKTEPQVQCIESQTRRDEQDPNGPRELTLDELSKIGGGMIAHAHAPVIDRLYR